MAGAIIAGVSAIGSIAAARQAEKEQKRQRVSFEQEAARQRAIRGRVAGELRPEILSDIRGQEPLTLQLARQREEALARQRISRQASVAEQELIDRLARVGRATGRTAADISAPAAQARLLQQRRAEMEGLRELAIRLAARNAERRERIRQAGQGRLLQLGQFEAGGFVPPPAQPSLGSAALGGFGELLSVGIEDILAKRRGGTSVPRGGSGGTTTSPDLPFPETDEIRLRRL